MRPVLFILLAICPFMNGCIPGIGFWDEQSYTISTYGLSDKWTALAWQAAEDWNAHSNDGHKIILRDDDFPAKILLEHCPPEDKWDGHWNIDRNGYSHINVCDHGTDYDRILALMRHEMGHMIGLSHVENTCAIMSPTACASWITEDDLKECRRVGAC